MPKTGLLPVFFYFFLFSKYFLDFFNFVGSEDCYAKPKLLQSIRILIFLKLGQSSMLK